MSTITARLTAENDEYIASITGGEGVIDKQTGELRSTFDILQDLSEAWEKLTSVEKQELAETVAGKNQRSLFTALMSNFETAVGATEAALNSEGSAAAENEKRMDSLQGKVQQLEGAWQNFARNTINSEAVKSLIDLGTQLIKLADSDIGRLIIALASAKAAMMLFNKVMGTKAVLTLSNSIKTQLITAITAMTISFKAGALSGGVLTGSLTALGTAIKGIGAALAANPIGLAITAFAVLTSAISSYTAKADEARQQSAELADKYQQEAEEAQGLLDTYNKLSKDKFRSIEDNETLSKTIEDLSKKYGVSEEALKSEGKQRDEAIKKIEDEIEARKLNAALQDEASVKWKNTGFLGLGGSEKEIFTSREMVDIQTNLADKYDTTGNTVAEVQKKLEGYITTLQNKSNKTKEEEKDLQKLKDAYSKVTDSVKTYGDSYAQSLSNFKEGIPITTEQANVLYQLGEITLAEAQATQSYNEWLNENKDATEEVKDAVYEGLMAQVEYQNQLDQNSESTKKLTDEQIEIKEKVDSANEAFKEANTNVDNYQKAFSTLTSAVDEYNNSGYMSIDTLQSLMAMDEQYLSMLSMENGQLVLNTQEMDNYINTMIAKKAEDLQAAATQDLLNLSLGNTSSLSSVAEQAIDELNTDVNNTKTDMQNAIPTMQQFGAELDNIAAKYGKGLGDKYKDEAGAIVDKYKDIFGTISGLGKTTSRAGGTSGSGHRYTGSSKRGSGGGKKSGSSKSAKEEYKAEVDALYWYKNALDNAEESVDKLNDALKNTDNFNEQEKYIRQLIDATNNQINKTNDLKNAQVGQINDFINQLRQQGFAIDYNAQSNELYINNMQHLSDLTGDAAKNAEKLLDKIQDLNDDNRDLDGSIRDLTADVKDYYEQLEDIPEKKLEKFNDLMEEFQQSYLDQVQYQIEDLEHAMENDERLKALNEQIEALEKQNDEVDKQKEMEEKLLAVEEAKLKLENARNQKTMQVYREGQGFVWEADFDAIKDAEEELKDAQDDLNQQIRDDQLEQLEAEKEAIENSYQDRIDALQNFLDEQEYLIDKANREGVQSFEELRNELKKYGLDSAEYLGKATDWLNNYNNALGSLNTTVQDILASSGNATSELVYSSAMQDRINQALSGMVPNVQQNPNAFGRSVSYDRITNDNQSVYINSIELPNVHNTDEFIKELKNLPRMAASNAALRK